MSINSMKQLDKAIDLKLSEFRIAIVSNDSLEKRNKIQERIKSDLFYFICELLKG